MLGFQTLGCGETERYFFNLQEAKNRSNRATRSGYWKVTGSDKPILGSKGSEIVGMKKVLVFHQGKPPHGIRTHWIMHEYHLAGPESIFFSASLYRKSSTQVCLFGYPYYLVEEERVSLKLCSYLIC